MEFIDLGRIIKFPNQGALDKELNEITPRYDKSFRYLGRQFIADPNNFSVIGKETYSLMEIRTMKAVVKGSGTLEYIYSTENSIELIERTPLRDSYCFKKYIYEDANWRLGETIKIPLPDDLRNGCIFSVSDIDSSRRLVAFKECYVKGPPFARG